MEQQRSNEEMNLMSLRFLIGVLHAAQDGYCGTRDWMDLFVLQLLFLF